MKRCDIWGLSDEGYASNRHPVVVFQSDEIAKFQSVVLCFLISFDSTHLPTRHTNDDSSENELSKTSGVIPDKITTLSEKMLHEKIGSLRIEKLHAIN